MTVDEIFESTARHMIEGLMFHSQLANYFGFLGFKGYQECHKYRYYDESIEYRCLIDYYLNHCNKLLNETGTKNPDVIPNDWYQYTRQQVNDGVRYSALKAGLEKWVSWERETKKLYEQYYQLLADMGETGAALELSKYVQCVDDELANAEQKFLELNAVGFNVADVMLEQDEIYRKYKKKIKEIELC